VALLQLGGLRGKQSTPSDWLGGTGVVSTVSEWERHGVRDVSRSGREGNGMLFMLYGRMSCFIIYVLEIDCIAIISILEFV
jgi:hypothetical protein